MATIYKALLVAPPKMYTPRILLEPNIDGLLLIPFDELPHRRPSTFLHVQKEYRRIHFSEPGDVHLRLAEDVRRVVPRRCTLGH